MAFPAPAVPAKRTAAAQVAQPQPCTVASSAATPLPRGAAVACAATDSASPSSSSCCATATAATHGSGLGHVDWRAVRGVLFDVDGTLVESDPLHFRA